MRKCAYYCDIFEIYKRWEILKKKKKKVGELASLYLNIKCNVFAKSFYEIHLYYPIQLN